MTDSVVVRYDDSTHSMDGEWVPAEFCRAMERQVVELQSQLMDAEFRNTNSRVSTIRWRACAKNLHSIITVGESMGMRRIILSEYDRLLSEHEHNRNH